MRKLKNEELGRLSPEDLKKVEKYPLVVVLDNIRSMYNVGSVFRTCDGFRVEKLVLSGITAQPPNREINKSALGAQETVRWEYFEDPTDAVEDLKREGYKVYAVEQAEKSSYLNELSIDDRKKFAFVFGNEVFGVSEDVMKKVDGCIEIPQFGVKHSFNISVSVGIVLWEFFRNINK